MTKRISKIRSQLGITSATVLMTLAVTGNYLVPPAHAAMRTGNSNDQTSILPNEITRELTRKITVIDPHFDQPQVHHQTVRFVNENGQWRPLGSNFLPPFFPVQYENYLASQTALKIQQMVQQLRRRWEISSATGLIFHRPQLGMNTCVTIPIKY